MHGCVGCVLVSVPVCIHLGLGLVSSGQYVYVSVPRLTSEWVCVCVCGVSARASLCWVCVLGWCECTLEGAGPYSPSPGGRVVPRAEVTPSGSPHSPGNQGFLGEEWRLRADCVRSTGPFAPAQPQAVTRLSQVRTLPTAPSCQKPCSQQGCAVSALLGLGQTSLASGTL